VGVGLVLAFLVLGFGLLGIFSSSSNEFVPAVPG
jgi:hypothetical protein